MQKGGVNSGAHVPAPEASAITHFLENVLRRPRFHLYYCDSEQVGKDRPLMIGGTFRSAARACEWVLEHNAAGRNIYWAINAPDAGRTKKAGVGDLRVLYGYHVDIDLPKGMDRGHPDADGLITGAVRRVQAHRKLPQQPTIIRTGNGVQAAWLCTPVDATPERLADMRAVNRAIKDLVKGDKTFNADRVLRLPGTVNWPDKLKLARGCVPVLATLECEQDRDFHVDDFAHLDREVAHITQVPGRGLTDYLAADYSDEWLAAKPYCWDEVKADLGPMFLLGLQPYRDDRSQGMWHFLCAMRDFLVRDMGCPIEQLRDWPDAAKNMAMLAVEASEDVEDRHNPMPDIIGHVVEHPQGYLKLSRDVNQVLHDPDAGKRAPTPEKVERQREMGAAITAAERGEPIDPAAAMSTFFLHMASDAKKEKLPNAIRGNDGTPTRVQETTLSNIEYVLKHTGIRPRWNVFKDCADFVIDDTQFPDRRSSQLFAAALAPYGVGDRPAIAIELILDGLLQFGMTNRAAGRRHLMQLARRELWNPLADYCVSRPWDGIDRYGEVAACLPTGSNMAYEYLRVFFRQTVGGVVSLRRFAATGTGDKLASCVVLVGAQGVGKTWFWEAVAPPRLMARGTSLKLGTQGELDSIRTALGGAVCCLNELGASLDRSHTELLKDFLSRDVDEYRLPYATDMQERPRMTSFCATANLLALRDETGSRRFLVINLDKGEKVDRERLESVDLQQVYAQAWHEVLEAGATWWLDESQDAEREAVNEEYETVGDAQQAVIDYLAEVGPSHTNEWMSCRQLCMVCGVEFKPSNWPLTRRLLVERGLEYRAKVTVSGKLLQKVWHFPVVHSTWVQVRNGLRH